MKRGKHSGQADRSHGCCRQRVRSGGYVPLHVGAAVERRDEAEEVAWPPQQGLREFPGIVEDESLGGFGPSNRGMAGGKLNRNRVSSGATVRLAEEKA